MPRPVASRTIVVSCGSFWPFSIREISVMLTPLESHSASCVSPAALRERRKLTPNRCWGVT
jgi:hypothetical protein